MTAAQKPPITEPRIIEINDEMKVLYRRVQESQSGASPVDPQTFLGLGQQFPHWRTVVAEAERLLTAARALLAPAKPENLAFDDLLIEEAPAELVVEAVIEPDVPEPHEEPPGTPEDGAPEETTYPAPEEPSAPVDAPTPARAYTADLQPGTGRLFGQLTGLLGDGDTVTLTVTRLGDELRVTVTPHPSSGEAPKSIVEFQVQATPALLDAEFDFALQPYAEARRDVITLAREAATKTRDAAKNTPATTAKPAKAAPAKKVEPSATLELNVSPPTATVVAVDAAGREHPVKAGKNSLPPGKYTLRGSQEGHETATAWVTLIVNKAEKASLALKPQEQLGLPFA